MSVPEDEGWSGVLELGELQITVLRVLWSHGDATVHEMLALLPAARTPAYTTVLTALRSLEKRGMVAHDDVPNSRMYRYRACMSLDAARSSGVQAMIGRIFDGHAGMLIRSLLQSHDCTPSMLRELASEFERDATATRAW